MTAVPSLHDNFLISYEVNCAQNCLTDKSPKAVQPFPKKYFA
jgi:hypothetical protein